MRVAMLGPFRLIRGDARPIEVGGQRVRMLLARLALEAGRTVPTEALIEDLWGANQPSGALNALQSLVSRARRALADEDELSVRSDSTGYALTVADDEVDVHRFERLVADGRRRLADQPAEATARLRTALDLWRGDALVDFPDAPFARPRAARLDELRLVALDERIEADLRLGRQTELVAELEGLCAQHPLRERFAALRMRALYSSGRQAEALALFDSLRRRLADELGLDPSRDLQDLHMAMLRGDRWLAEPERKQVVPTPPSPPTRLSSFVGREAEVHKVAVALGRSRLVTLFGPGGAGKTRLAVESITNEHRTWFVELAASGGGNDLLSTILLGVGVREGRLLENQRVDAVSRLVETFSAEPALLVLDNCEHVIADVATLVQDLLTRCPGLRVLATSREPLAVTSEELLSVGPLELPASDDAVDAPSVRLFADRAAGVRPGFALDARNIGDVVEICRRLDGLPLAIELAAARLRAMSVRQIADRLDDRFRLLTSGNRSSLPRHRTLRAVVEWSWDLLAEHERVLARRMSVFAGAVTVESVAAVCGDDADDALYVLVSLVEKSLVEASETDEGMRYRMLETVRAYCAERLEDAGERDGTRTAHAAHFLEFAESAAWQIFTADQIGWLDKLDAEHDNIMAALRWSRHSGDAERAVRISAAMAWYWALSLQTAETVARFKDVVAIEGNAAPDARAALALTCSLMPAEWSWTEPVRKAAEESRATNAMARYEYVAFLEPVAWWMIGDETGAEDSVQRALAHPSPWANAAGIFARAFIAERCGDVVNGERYMREAASAFRALGDRWGVAQTVSSLAGYRSLRGDQEGAIEVLRQSEQSIVRLRFVEDLVSVKVRIGLERLRSGDFDGARSDLDESARLAGSSPLLRASALRGLSEVARYNGDLDSAWRYHGEFRGLLDDATPDQQPLRQMMLVSEAQLHLDADQFELARERLAEALIEGTDFQDMPFVAMIAEQTARLRFALGAPEESVRLLGMAVVLRGMLDEGDPEIRALRGEIGKFLDPDRYRIAFEEGARRPHNAVFAELRRTLGVE